MSYQICEKLLTTTTRPQRVGKPFDQQWEAYATAANLSYAQNWCMIVTDENGIPLVVFVAGQRVYTQQTDEI